MDQQQAPISYQEQNIPIYYHNSTSNKSFIAMSNYLKSIGIKNHKFMLQLLDPDLVNIDPFDPDLSKRDKMKVFYEVINNFWYYLREIVRIPTSGPAVPFELNRGNMAYLYLATMNINTILLLPRQTGKTIGSCCFYLYIYNFKTRNATIPLLNKEWKDSKDNLSRIRKIRDALPSYLRMDAVFSSQKGANGKKLQVQSNASFMENLFNRNRFVTYGKARNASTAMSLLRGTTIANLWVDEFAFVPFMKEIYGNTAPAMTTAMAIAKRNNVPYGILYTTTPGFLTTDEGMYAYEVINDATKFNEKWYDLSYYQIKDIIDSNKFSTFVHIQFTYKNLGFDDKWFYEVCRKQNWDWTLIRREYLLEWSNAAEKCPFTKEELDIVLKFCKDPINTCLILNKYELKIFEKIPLLYNNVPKYPPIIGVDVSGGVQKDYSCLTFIDSRTTRVFAELRSNFISIIELARVIEFIVINMMPNAIVNIERNGGFGSSVIAKLKETRVKRNLYYEIKDRTIEENIVNGKVVRKKVKTKIFGTDSSKGTRDLLIELLKERVRLHKDKFISKTLYEEMRGLEENRNGRVDHSTLSHDDQIFSYLMGLYVWYEGKNLRENFGIDKCPIKTEDSVDDIVDLDQNVEYGNVFTETDDIYPQSEDPEVQHRAEETKEMIKDMQRSKRIMMETFLTAQRKKEEEDFQQLLRSNKAVQEGYARLYNIPIEQVQANQSGTVSNTDAVISNDVFNSFNMTEEEMQAAKLMRLRKNEPLYNHLSDR